MNKRETVSRHCEKKTEIYKRNKIVICFDKTKKNNTFEREKKQFSRYLLLLNTYRKYINNEIDYLNCTQKETTHKCIYV